MTASRRVKLLFLMFWGTSAFFVNPFGEIMSDASLGTAVNLVARGSLEVSPQAAIDLSLVNGKYYCGVGPGSWLIATPYYFVFQKLIAALPAGWVKSWASLYAMKHPHLRPPEVYFLQILMVFLLVAPLGAFFGIQVFRLLCRQGHSERLALLLTLPGCFSLAFVYSCVFSRQFLASVLIWSVFLFWVNRSEGSRARGLRYPIAVGLLMGLAVATDYLSILLCIPAVWLLSQKQEVREWRAMLAGLGTALCALGGFHTWLYGRPWLTPYSFRAWNDQIIRLTYKGEVVASNSYQVGAMLGLLHPSLESVQGLLISPFKGLFVFSPVLLAGLYFYLFRSPEGRMALVKRFALSSFALCLTFVASLKGELYWSGVPQFFGPRYLLGCIPLGILGVGLLRLTSSREKLAVACLSTISIFVALLGAMFHDEMLMKWLDDPFLQRPLSNLFWELLSRGPRVPLLDIYGAGNGVQAALIALLFFAWLFLIRAFKSSKVAEAGRPAA